MSSNGFPSSPNVPQLDPNSSGEGQSVQGVGLPHRLDGVSRPPPLFSQQPYANFGFFPGNWTAGASSNGDSSQGLGISGLSQTGGKSDPGLAQGDTRADMETNIFKNKDAAQWMVKPAGSSDAGASNPGTARGLNPGASNPGAAASSPLPAFNFGSNHGAVLPVVNSAASLVPSPVQTPMDSEIQAAASTPAAIPEAPVVARPKAKAKHRAPAPVTQESKSTEKFSFRFNDFRLLLDGDEITAYFVGKNGNHKSIHGFATHITKLANAEDGKVKLCASQNGDFIYIVPETLVGVNKNAVYKEGNSIFIKSYINFLKKNQKKQKTKPEPLSSASQEKVVRAILATVGENNEGFKVEVETFVKGLKKSQIIDAAERGHALKEVARIKGGLEFTKKRFDPKTTESTVLMGKDSSNNGSSSSSSPSNILRSPATPVLEGASRRQREKDEEFYGRPSAVRNLPLRDPLTLRKRKYQKGGEEPSAKKQKTGSIAANLTTPRPG